MQKIGWRKETRACAVLLVCAAAAITSQAQTLTTLASFNGPNGCAPISSLVQGADGNFYGTTGDCGLYNDGTVFKITPAGTLTTLYNFAAISINPGSPGLIQATDGNFYGTTEYDGAYNRGTVFKITPGGTLMTLYSFGTSPADGTVPTAALVQGADGSFYGTTSGGGAFSHGAIFKITPVGTLTTLYSFGTSSADGAVPTAALIQGADGNFYGTTSSGGAFNHGAIFKITPAGTVTTLYSFGASSTDGANPQAALIQATDGNFYGTASQGGGPRGDGVVFKITPGGTLTTLYGFSPGGPDGTTPAAALIQAADGNFYGTTSGGGADDQGTIFKITPGGTLTTLYSFNPQAHDAEGASAGAVPLTSLIQATNGNFYGTTSEGGATGGGTVFSLQTALSQTVSTPISFSNCPGSGRNYSLAASCTVSPYGPMTVSIAITPLGSDFYTATFGFVGSGASFNAVDTDRGATVGENTVSASGTATITGGTGTLAGASGSFTYNVAGNGTIANETFTLTGAGTLITPINTTPPPYSCATQPAITFIDSASAYGGYSYFASGTWLEIKGTNLVNPADPRLTASPNPGQWTAADFNGVNAPTVLDNVSVTINGKPAYVWFLSAGQINVQAPEDTATGNVAITVNNCTTSSAPFMFKRQALAPGFLAPSNYSSNGTQYLVAFFDTDNAYVLNTSVGASFGVNSRPAKPGDQVYTYGIGFGDVTPTILPGVIAGASNMLVNPVAISFGSTPAVIAYQGLTPGSVGLYQFNFTVPSGLANGDYQINATQNGVAVAQTMYLTVQN